MINNNLWVFLFFTTLSFPSFADRGGIDIFNASGETVLENKMFVFQELDVDKSGGKITGRTLILRTANKETSRIAPFRVSFCSQASDAKVENFKDYFFITDLNAADLNCLAKLCKNYQTAAQCHIYEQ